MVWLPKLMSRLFGGRQAAAVATPPERSDPELERRIQQKWLRDSRSLPLTNAHRELYAIIHRGFWSRLRDFPDLINCRDFNDRMQWLKLFDQHMDIVNCSDKILVRDRISRRLGDGHLTKLYQVCDSFSQINFDDLPGSFVIKANHDSGTAVLVPDKSSLDKKAAELRIEMALGEFFGWDMGEWAYRFVTRRILVEELLEPHSATPPADYKFYCVNGKVKFLHYINERGANTKEQTIDLNGNDLKTALYTGFEYGSNFKKPSNWNDMISVSERLSHGFKFVRVDLYSVSGRIFAGELTFWPGAGLYAGDGQRALGQLLDFDRTTFRPPIVAKLLKRSR